MLNRTAAFDAAVAAGTATWASRVEVWHPGALVPAAVLQPTDGEITADSTRAVMRTATASLRDPTRTLVPADLADLLGTGGAEMHCFKGLRLADGTTELLPQGVFILNDTEVADEGQGTVVRVEGVDRAQRVIQARYRVPLAIADGTTIPATIHAIVDTRLSATQLYNFTTTAATTAAVVLGVDDNADPWADARTFAAAAGCRLYFDPAGTLVLKPVPDPLAHAVAWTYAEGAESLLVKVNRNVTSIGSFNHVVGVAKSSTLAAPLWAEAYDNNPASPTYVGSPIGTSEFGDRVAPLYTSDVITDLPTLQAAVDALLADSMGLNEVVSLTARHHPALEPDDVIGVTRASVKVDGAYVLPAFSFGIAPGANFTGTSRVRKVA